MTFDRVIALLSLAGFFAFLFVSAFYIREFDLIVVFSVTLALAAFDFWKTLFRPDAGNSGNKKKS